MTRTTICSALTLVAALFAGCASAPPPPAPLALASQVDLPRYMGDWYVIACIPTVIEKGNRDAIESYRLNDDGTVATSFSAIAAGARERSEPLRSKAIVLDAPRNAVWGQQYLWPFKADYRIALVADDYSVSVVAREKRDYVWILSRTPAISEARYAELVAFIGAQGYDTAKLVRTEQSAAGQAGDSRR